MTEIDQPDESIEPDVPESLPEPEETVDDPTVGDVTVVEDET